jgi:hypothetical protein
MFILKKNTTNKMNKKEKMKIIVKLHMVAPAYNPSTKEADTGGS